MKRRAEKRRRPSLRKRLRELERRRTRRAAPKGRRKSGTRGRVVPRFIERLFEGGDY